MHEKIAEEIIEKVIALADELKQLAKKNEALTTIVAEELVEDANPIQQAFDDLQKAYDAIKKHQGQKAADEAIDKLK